MTEPWGLLVQQGNEALLEGRFRACERLAARAAELAPGQAAPGLLAVAARREQGRAAEAELLARDLVAAHPDAAEAHALLGAVLADLGRDAEAGRQLDGLDAPMAATTVAALAAEIVAVLNLPRPAEVLHTRLAPRAGEVVPLVGAVARHVGLLCHVLGRWDEAESAFEAALGANRDAGAPVFVAHTRRQYAALLRARGDDGDWERAIDLLGQAASVYRRLEIDRLGDESETVLRRSLDMGGDGPDAATVHVFRRVPQGWELSYGDGSAVVADSPGLGHLAALVAADGRPVHVVDLAAGLRGLNGEAGAAGPLLDQAAPTDDGLRDLVLAEYRERLAQLDGQAAGAGDPAAAALARAERDLLCAGVASATTAGATTAGASAAGAEAGDTARRLVALRTRIALDRIEEVLPDLARHLRRGIRTGTFCLYEPQRPERWKMGP